MIKSSGDKGSDKGQHLTSKLSNLQAWARSAPAWAFGAHSVEARVSCQGEVDLLGAREWGRSSVQGAIDYLAHVLKPPGGPAEAPLPANGTPKRRGRVEAELHLLNMNRIHYS